MLQHSRPLPADAPLCADGHRPQLVVTHGAPSGHPIGRPVVPLWHVECAICSVATIPSPLQNHALLRWRKPGPQRDLELVPLSQLAAVRARVSAAVSHAA